MSYNSDNGGTLPLPGFQRPTSNQPGFQVLPSISENQHQLNRTEQHILMSNLMSGTGGGAESQQSRSHAPHGDDDQDIKATEEQYTNSSDEDKKVEDRRMISENPDKKEEVKEED